VESEDLPDRMLLETRISKDDGYQKQQGSEARGNYACTVRSSDYRHFDRMDRVERNGYGVKFPRGRWMRCDMVSECSTLLRRAIY